MDLHHRAREGAGLQPVAFDYSANSPKVLAAGLEPTFHPEGAATGATCPFSPCEKSKVRYAGLPGDD